MALENIVHGFITPSCYQYQIWSFFLPRDFTYRYSTQVTLGLSHMLTQETLAPPCRLLGLLTGCLSTVRVIQGFGGRWREEEVSERDSIGSLLELQSLLTADQHETREKPILSFFQLSFWQGIRKWISPRWDLFECKLCLMWESLNSFSNSLHGV